MNIKQLTFLAALAATLVLAPRAAAHCQIPCGIYDDKNVMDRMHTDYETIEKSVKMIPELMKDPAKNANQVGRWIFNKEQHAQAIQDTVGAYFLAQRLKPDEAGSDNKSYLRKLTACHRVIVAAMKCKQGVNPADVEKLHDELHEFAEAFGLEAN
ncbi:MAG: hypothetical protein HKN82_00010 [Akkermansiaceae bacterium]|nr:hypothetical protein [Akkermansiaceae bacterium]